MHTRGAVSLRPGSQQGQRRDSVSVGVVRGVSPCLAFPSGQGRSAQGCPHPPVSPPPSGGSTLSPHRAHSPPPICAASPVRIRPSRPRAHPTQLWDTSFPAMSHTPRVIHTQLHRVVQSAPPITHSFTEFLPQFPSQRLLPQLHTPPPPHRCSHTRVTCGLTCRAPTLQRCTLAAHALTRAHTCAHTRSVIILDMPFLLCDSSSRDAQSCHLDEK